MNTLSRLEPEKDWNTRLGLGLILILSLGWAFANRFILDDAFISFRYARNLAEGQGLVFNPGERVEGYTNFLWTLAMTPAFLLDIDPILFSWAVSLALFPASIVLTYRIGTLLSASRATGLTAAFLTGTHYTYSAFATGGMETHLQSFLFLALVFLFLRIRERPRPARLTLFSLTAAAAFLTRMDSACFIGPAYLFLAVHLWSTDRRKALGRWAVLAGPAFFVAALWMVWRFSYYGALFPNTFLAKTRTPGLVPGLYYVALYFVSYGFVLAVPVLLTGWLRTRARPAWSFDSVFLGSAVFCWISYIVAVGGDFMEFRMMAVIAPFLFLGMAWGLWRGMGGTKACVVGAVFLSAISLAHSRRTRLYGVETVRGLEHHVREASWMEVGQALHTLWGDTDVLLATTAAGAIPFYARLPTVDMLGLNDAWIARNGIPAENPARGRLGEKAGHRIKAPMAYLEKRGVHLLIGHPRIGAPDRKRLSAETLIGPEFYRLDRLPAEDTHVLEIPVAPDRVLTALYLRSHPAIEKSIVEGDWRRYPAEHTRFP